MWHHFGHVQTKLITIIKNTPGNISKKIEPKNNKLDRQELIA